MHASKKKNWSACSLFQLLYFYPFRPRLSPFSTLTLLSYFVQEERDMAGLACHPKTQPQPPILPKPNKKKKKKKAKKKSIAAMLQ